MSFSDIEPDDLPDTIPVFPLNGVVLLPGADLPLNVFEPRYLAMVDDTLKTDQRLIGIIQPQIPDDLTLADKTVMGSDDPVKLYRTGGAGRLISFSETSDGRYLITLKGIRRFDIGEELSPKNGYRRIRPDWGPYKADGLDDQNLNLDRTEMKSLLSQYFDMNDLSCDWNIIDETSDERLITCLSMICPFKAQEKQALLEADNNMKRAEKFLTVLKMSLYDDTSENGCH